MKALALAAVLAAATFVSALDYSAAGFTPLGSVNVEGKTFDKLSDATGGELLFSAEAATPSQETLANFAKALTVLRSWQSISIAEIRAIAEPGRIRVLIVPASIKRGSTELVGYVVGGLQFFVASGVEYDFRVKSGSYFIRLSGVLASESELLGDIASSAADPVAYLAARDPQYAVRRVTELEGRLGSLENDTSAKFDSLAEDNAATVSELEAKIADLGASRDEANARLDVLEKALDALEKNLAAESKLRSEVLEAAIMAALNKGLFGGPKPLNAEAVATLVELKTADPSLTKEAAAAALKAQGISLSSKEIGIVFLVKFGES